MARYRISGPAKPDLAAILQVSAARHGPEARLRYRAILAAAMRRPWGPSPSSISAHSRISVRPVARRRPLTLPSGMARRVYPGHECREQR